MALIRTTLRRQEQQTTEDLRPKRVTHVVKTATNFRAIAHRSLPDVFHVIGTDDRGHPVAHRDDQGVPAWFNTEAKAKAVADELNAA